MPSGGVLTIETRNDTIDDATRGGHPECGPGNYAVISVSDTGVGMSREVQGRIFEPFYTTKERGRGTGLGLAAVHGIVKQLDGHIFVASQIGQGSQFTIYLPATSQAAPEAVRATRQSAVPVGHETILLVEDEPSVRRFARTILTRHGYRVMDAESAEAAVSTVRRDGVAIDLLVTDVMLSGRDGGQLATELRRDSPALPVLFISGYADPFVRQEFPAGCELLEKPFTAHTLLWRVRGALNRQPS